MLSARNTPHLQTWKLKVKGRKMIYQANRSQKKAGIAIVIVDQVDLNSKLVREKGGH
jgi:hypothetical protein